MHGFSFIKYIKKGKNTILIINNAQYYKYWDYQTYIQFYMYQHSSKIPSDDSVQFRVNKCLTFIEVVIYHNDCDCDCVIYYEK